MLENINKALYLGFGVILLVMALTSFYRSNESYMAFNQVYEEAINEEDSWLKDVNKNNSNPLSISVPFGSNIQAGLVFRGSEVKAQLVVYMNQLEEYQVYKEGIEIRASELPLLYNSILDNEQMLITYDEELKAVYIVGL